MQMRCCIRAELSLTKARTVRLQTSTHAGLQRMGEILSAHKHQLRSVLLKCLYQPHQTSKSVQYDLCFPDINRPQINRAGGCAPKRIAIDNPVYLSRSEMDRVTEQKLVLLWKSSSDPKQKQNNVSFKHKQECTLK